MKTTFNKVQSSTIVRWFLFVIILTGIINASYAQSCSVQINCPGNIVTNAASGQCGAAVTFNTTATVNCPSVQDQTSPDGGTIWQSKTSYWQSFTAGITGQLTGVAVEGWWTNVTTGYTLNIFTGVGTGGTLLYSQAVVLPNSGPGILDILQLSPGAALAAGQQYTWNLTNPTGFSMIGYPWASYAGGHGDEWLSQPGWQGMDYHFATYMANTSFTIVSTPASGSTFNIGTTTVNSIATDAEGNTSSCSFTVTVNDNQPPVINCPGNIVTNAAAGQCSAAVTFNVTASDNCQPSTSAQDQTSPDIGTIWQSKTSYWQSFTPGVTGTLTGVAVEGWWSNVTTGYTLKIYSGVGVGGTLLYSQAVVLPNSGYGLLDNLALSSGVSLTAGQSYTWNLTNSTGFSMIGYPWASYAGGHGDEWLSQPGWQGMDYHFATYMIPTSVTIVNTPASGSTFNVGTTTVNSVATDMAGNTSTCSFTVTVTTAPLSITNMSSPAPYNGYNIRCNGGNAGTASVSATGGCTPYTYLWSNGQTSCNPANLSAGIYTVTVTDASGHSVTASVTLTAPSPLTVNAGSDEQTYFGYTADQTVTHTAVALGGTGGYSYSWSLNRVMKCNQANSAGDEYFSAGTCTNNICGAALTTPAAPVCNGSATVTARLLEDGIICLMVTDANGCSASDCFNLNSEDARCFAGNSGITKVKVCHHTGSSSNPWVQLCISQNDIASHLAENPLDYVGTCGSRLDNTSGGIDLGISVYPNPAGNNVSVEFASPSAGNYLLTLFDITGRVVMNTPGTAFEGGNKIILPLTEIQNGIYNLRLMIGDESSSVRLVVAR